MRRMFSALSPSVEVPPGDVALGPLTPCPSDVSLLLGPVAMLSIS